MADDVARDPKKAAGDLAAAANARCEQEKDDEEETPEWYKLMRRPTEEMEAKRLAWLESKTTGRPDAETEAKRLEWLHSRRKHRPRRPPGSVYVDRTNCDAVRPIIQRMEFLCGPCSYCCCRNRDSISMDRPSSADE